MKRHLKLTAAVAVVLLTLSGFSINKSSGGRGSSGGSVSKSSGGKGGGGCSSKKSSSHSSTDSGKGSSWKDDGYRGSRSSTTGTNNGSSSRNRAPQGSVVECLAANGGKASSTVRVRSRSSSYRTYTVEVDFLGQNGTVVDTGTATAGVSGNRSKTVSVSMKRPSLVQEVDDCRLKSVR